MNQVVIAGVQSVMHDVDGRDTAALVTFVYDTFGSGVASKQRVDTVLVASSNGWLRDTKGYDTTQNVSVR